MPSSLSASAGLLLLIAAFLYIYPIIYDIFGFCNYYYKCYCEKSGVKPTTWQSQPIYISLMTALLSIRYFTPEITVMTATIHIII